MPRLAAHAVESVRALPERHGRVTLAVLLLILALGFGLRIERVIDPNAHPGDDALAYTALAKSLYEEGSYGGQSFDNSSDWSPGAPLAYAGLYYLTGGARDGAARLLQALLGTAAIVVVFLLGRRIACRPAGLLAAGAVAVYPPFIHSTGAVLSEPLAIFTFPAAVLALLWAADRRGTWEWVVPGLLLGITALIRPEYLVVGVLLAVVVLIFRWRQQGLARGAAATAVLLVALALPILPWTVRNIVVLDRFVPISTGGGKALYVGTYLPADGDYQRVKATLLERFRGRRLEPNSEALDQVDPEPLFDRVAARYPDLPRDEALGKIGRQQLSDDLGDHPLDYAAMTVRKVWRMWSSGVGEAMASTPGRVVQMIVVLLGLAGLGVLLVRRRFLEAIVFAVPIATVTAIGAVTLASNRRSEVLMTLVFPLAAAAITRWVALSRQRLGEGRAPAGPSHSRAQA
jgi:4-amino-4-deoxy-L-arabinose transferase-like glycosyltransferase